MMENYSIDFYSKTEAAVTLKWPVEYSEGDIKLMELITFTCYLIRQMSNLGNHPANLTLMKQILEWKVYETSYLLSILGWAVYPNISKEQHVLYEAAINSGVDIKKAQEKFGQEIHLVPYRGRGDRRFTGEMKIERNYPAFILNVQGFGLGILIGHEVPLYATDSVFHFLAFLLNKYSKDLQLTHNIVRAMKTCVGIYQEGIITNYNQSIIAYKVVADTLFRIT